MQQQHSQLLHGISAILFAADPMEINFGNNTDEYDPEARSIILRLTECRDIRQLQQAVYQEFIRWFGEDAGTVDKYQQIAEAIWILWQTTETECDVSTEGI